MTSPSHPSGTDRLGEVMQSVHADIYVNLQGDEPLVRPADIDLLIQGMLADPSVHVGTLCHDIDAREALDPNTGTAVLADNGDALGLRLPPRSGVAVWRPASADDGARRET
ncbi:hypothetical protein G6F63_015541 [Rhizopus arrhizus]|nr:hypothetical protein G6F63_015541 [Rhizopus arrhizus]